MISSLQGTIDALGADHVMIAVGGIGFHVFAPTRTIAGLGQQGAQVRLFTHLELRDDGLKLYGFSSHEELRLFELLITVAGVGPKTGLVFLSVYSPAEVASAVLTEDLTALSRVPGVGRKTAARIVLELKPRLEKEWAGATPRPAGPVDPDALAALVALGYGQDEARTALSSLERAHDASTEEKVRLALQQLGRG